MTENQSYLAQRAVLMRLSIGCPGTERSDRKTSAEIKAYKGLGQNSGKWVKEKYPPEALKDITKLDGEASRYHNAVTLPFDRGLGILPCALIVEYGDKMREFKSKRDALIQNFAKKYPDFIEWAKKEHNGTFDVDDYPPVEVILSKFTFRTEPLPVPNSCHFESTVTSLLGLDATSVDERIRDAAQEAQQELMRRMVEPVSHMAKTLAKDSPKIFDTLTANIKDIAELVPKLNLAGDVHLDMFARELKSLSAYTYDELKTDEGKKKAQAHAMQMLEKLQSYKL